MKITITIGMYCERCRASYEKKLDYDTLDVSSLIGLDKNPCPRCKDTLRIYGYSFSNSIEDLTRCVKVVHDAGRFGNPKQCLMKRGHGENGEYCKRHSK